MQVLPVVPRDHRSQVLAYLSRLGPFILATGITTGVLLLGPVTYLKDSDDVALVYFVTQGAACPFISPACSKILGLSYGFAPGIPWYGLLLYATLFHTLWMSLLLIRKTASMKTMAGGCIAVAWIILFASLMGSPTYTVTSILASGVAIIGLFDALSDQSGKRQASKPWALAYGVLLALGYMIRQFSVGAAVCALLPLPLAFSVARLRLRSAMIATVIVFALPLAGTVILDLAVMHHQTTMERDWLEYNWVRGWVQSSSTARELSKSESILRSAGWNLADFEAFCNFVFFYDEQRFTVERLRSLKAISHPQTCNLKLNSKIVLEDCVDAGAAFFCYLGTLVCLGAWLIQRGRWPWVPLFSAGSFLLIALGLQIAVHFPARVSVPMFLVATLGMFRAVLFSKLAVSSHSHSFTWRVASVLCSAAALAVLTNGLAIHRWTIGRPLQASRQQRIVDALADIDTPALLVMPNCSQYLIDPHVLVSRPIKARSLWTGWATYSPLFYERLADFGVDTGHDLLPSMIDRDDRFILARQSHVRTIIDICDRVHGIQVVLESVIKLDGNVGLYRIRRQPM